MTNRLTIKITPGMAASLGIACTAIIAGDPDNEHWHTLDHFLYWCTHVDATANPFTFVFTKAEDGSLGRKEARMLRKLLLLSRKHAGCGQTLVAIRRRIAKIESALNIDPVTRLGAVTDDAGRTAL